MLGLTLAGAATMSLAVQLLLQLAMLSVIGPNRELDALQVALTVSHLFATIMSASLVQVIVPLLAGWASEDGRTAIWRFLGHSLGVVLASAAFLYWAAPVWVSFFAPGFTNQDTLRAVELARIVVLCLPLQFLHALQVSLAHSRERFVLSEVAAIIGVLCCLALVLIFDSGSSETAAWGHVVRFVVASIVLLPLMGCPWGLSGARLSHGMILSRLRPLIAGSSLYKLDVLIDRILLSSMGPGAISIFTFASQLVSAAGTVTSKAVVTPALPRLSAAHVAADQVLFRMTLSSRQQSLAWMTLLVVCVALAGGVSPVDKLGELVRVSSVDMATLVETVWGLLGVTVGAAFGSLYASAFYAVGDTRTPTIVGLCAFLFGAGLKIASGYTWGMPGLALASSGYYLISAIALASVLWVKLDRAALAPPQQPHR